MRATVSLGLQDWSLHRKGPKDQARHQEKVREVIKGNLGEIISNESIITSHGDKIVLLDGVGPALIERRLASATADRGRKDTRR